MDIWTQNRDDDGTLRGGGQSISFDFAPIEMFGACTLFDVRDVETFLVIIE